MTSYALFPTAIGTCGLLWADSGILGLQLPEATEALTARRLLGDQEATETEPPLVEGAPRPKMIEALQ